jgi:hypothetical protein
MTLHTTYNKCVWNCVRNFIFHICGRQIRQICRNAAAAHTDDIRAADPPDLLNRGMKRRHNEESNQHARQAACSTVHARHNGKALTCAHQPARLQHGTCAPQRRHLCLAVLRCFQGFARTASAPAAHARCDYYHGQKTLCSTRHCQRFEGAGCRFGVSTG